jgi:hypothetical protein
VTRYPIVIAEYDAEHRSTLTVCTRCDTELDWDPEDGDPTVTPMQHGNPRNGGCGGRITFKYVDRVDPSG